MHGKATIQWLFQYIFNITLQSAGNCLALKKVDS